MRTKDPLTPREITDPEVLGAFAALLRAQKRAEEIAARTRTAVIYQIDGKLVRVYPKLPDSEEPAT